MKRLVEEKDGRDDRDQRERERYDRTWARHVSLRVAAAGGCAL
jgi:hypothetical protein